MKTSTKIPLLSTIAALLTPGAAYADTTDRTTVRVLRPLIFAGPPTSTGVLLTHEAKPGWRRAAKRRAYRKLEARRRVNRRAAK
jgi:hypothetical protein